LAQSQEFADQGDPTRPKTFPIKPTGLKNLGSSEMPSKLPLSGAQRAREKGRRLRPSASLWRYCHINCYNRTELARRSGRAATNTAAASIAVGARNRLAVVLGGHLAGINDISSPAEGKAVATATGASTDGWRREKPNTGTSKKSYSPSASAGDAPRPPRRAGPAAADREPHDFTNLKKLGIRWRIGGESGTVALDLAPDRAGS